MKVLKKIQELFEELPYWIQVVTLLIIILFCMYLIVLIGRPMII